MWVILPPSSGGSTGVNRLELPISLAMEIGPKVSQSPSWTNWSKSWSLDGTVGEEKAFFLLLFLAGVTSLELLSFIIAI